MMKWQPIWRRRNTHPPRRVTSPLQRLALACAVGLTGLGVIPGAGAQDVTLESSAAAAGAGIYRDGRWSLTRVALDNPAAVDGEALAIVRQTAAPQRSASDEGGADPGPGSDAGTVQFGARVWVPAGARRRVVVPLRPTPVTSGVGRSYDLESLVVLGAAGAESASPASPSAIVRSEDDTMALGVLNAGARGALNDSLRVAAEGRRRPVRLVSLGPDALGAMRQQTAWDSLDVVVAASIDGPLGEAQLESLRAWLLGGGRLWLMADGEGIDALGRRLLGPDWGLTVIGRTEVTRIPAEGLGGTQPPREATYPMARVRWPGAEVVSEWQGYPTLLRRDVGRGRVLVTTLPVDAWLSADGATEGPAMDELTALLHDRASLLSKAAAIEQERGVRGAVGRFGQGQVGYEVPGRAWVLVVLSAFIAALCAAGVWLSRRGRPEWFGWWGVALAGVAAALLIGIGLAQQSAVPTTLAEAQVAHLVAGHSAAVMESTVSFYRPPAAPDPGRIAGGAAVPRIDDALLASGNPRLVWSDRNAWSFELLGLPPGVMHTLRVGGTVPTAQPIEAVMDVTADTAGTTAPRGRFVQSAEGVAAPHDTVLATPWGRYAVAMDDAGGFTLPDEQPLGPGVYTSGSTGGVVLSAGQVAQSGVMEALLNDDGYITGPTLVGWLDGLDSGVHLTGGEDNAATQVVRRREAAVALPLRVLPPPPGSVVRLHPALLTQGVPAGERLGTVYDPLTASWLPGISNGQTVWLRFAPPTGVELATLSEVRVHLDIDAPQRPVRLLTRENNTPRELARLDGPAGPVTLTLTGAQLPALLPDGGIILGIEVGEPATVSAMPPSWTVQMLNLGVTGTTAPGSLRSP